MTQGNLLPGQKSVSFKIIQGHGFLTWAFRDLELYCRYCLVYDNLLYIYIIYIQGAIYIINYC